MTPSSWQARIKETTPEEKNFSARFKEALDFDPFPLVNAPNHPFLSNMQGVYNLFDLYEQLDEMLAKRKENDASFDNAKLNEFKDFIEKQLFLKWKDDGKAFSSDFLTMMNLLDDIRRDWVGINRWLSKAGARKRNIPDYNPRWPELPTFPNFPDLDSRMRAALETPAPFPVTLAGWNIQNSMGYWEALTGFSADSTKIALEQYFFLPFEDIKLIIDTVENYRSSSSIKNETARQNLPAVFALLKKAYTEKAWSTGLKTLAEKRTISFVAMLNYALGEPEDKEWAALNNKTITADILRELETDNSITQQYLAEKLFIQRKDFLYLLDLYKNQQNRSPEDWQRLYRLLESARRIKRKLSDPILGYEIFSGIFATAEASNAKTRGDNWRTFGGGNAAERAEIGLAFCSPLLQLAEGDREVTLKLTTEPFSLPGGKSFSEYFDFQFSTSEGWQRATASSAIAVPSSSIKNLTIKLSLSADVPPIVPPPPGLVPGDPAFPVLKMALRQTPNGAEYPLLKNLILKKVELSVLALGLRPTLAQNDTGILDATKAFEPFGPAPRAGSVLLFAHPELCFKPLTKIGFLFDWKGIIGNLLSTHYTNYPAFPTEATAAAQLSLLKRGNLVMGPKPIGLFLNYPSSTTNSDPVYKVYDLTNIPEVNDGTAADAITDWRRYWRLELSADFNHADYPRIAAEKAMDFAIAVNLKTDLNVAKNLAKLNPPYTPHLKTFKLYYEASAVLLDVTAENNPIFSERHALWQLHPFGHRPLRKESRPIHPKEQCFLLPNYTWEAELYIGLRDSSPLQQVALLFQMAEGSADPDLEKTPLEWSYLTPQGWQVFDKGEILLDETDSFANSGILQVVLPAKATNQNPLMPLGLHWLRASITANRGSVCDAIGIFTQAVTASRVLDSTSLDDPGQALPPDTIKGFYERQAGIKKVEQPFVSFGGRSAEADREFYIRVSERLRHRRRALTQWDVERLVLQRFTDVYKAKCLPPSDVATGEVKIIVVPDIRGKVLYDAYQPKMPLNRLAEISAYLGALGSPLAQFKVLNPIYISLEVQAYVSFRPGFDPRYYLGRLDEELRQFLAPWAFDEGADIAINHTIYPSVVVNFIEERPYVDFVAGVRLFQTDPESKDKINIVDADSDGVQPPARPEAIWVSAKKHLIELTESRPDQVSITYEGIEFMRIEYDFEVA